MKLAVALLTFALLAAPLAAEAQPRGKVPRIGILPAGPLPPRLHQYEAFRGGLRELGWIEGQNVVLEFRAPDREGAPYEGLAADLVRLNVDVIVASNLQGILAARRATRSIPIIMTGTGGDPVDLGLVRSLARPGGNITGLSLLSPELIGKRVELLREIAPALTRIGVLVDPGNPGGAPQADQVEAIARRVGLETLRLTVNGESELDGAFRTATRNGTDGLIVPVTALFYGLRARITALAQRHGLPAVYSLRGFADVGGLAFYGPSDIENYRRAATYIDRILKGAKPADLPVEQPTKFELVINLKTAKALGLTIPQSVLLRADEVIQ